MKKYKAFISYSHKDDKIAEKLHKYLENFRIPRNLRSKYNYNKKSERRNHIYPVFRDREELPSSANLGEQIQSALASSEYLIVICSPSSAQSLWVNEEILAFKKMGKADKVLSLIIDGEPHAEMKEGIPNSFECFPVSLKYYTDEHGGIDKSRSIEPIAADYRQSGDGPKNSFLKIAAGLLNTGFDELKQRDIDRRLNRAYILIVTALFIISMIGGMYYKSIQSEKEALRQTDLARWLLYKASILQAETQLHFGREDLSREALWNAPSEYSDWEWGFLANQLYPDDIELSGHTDNVTKGIFSHNDKFAASASKDSTVIIWDLEKKKAAYVLENHNSSVLDLVFSPDDRLLASSSADGTVILWRSETGKIHKRFETESSEITIVKFSDNGELLFAGGDDGKIYLWSVYEGKKIFSYTDKATYRSGIADAEFFLNDSSIAIVSEDITIDIWNIEKEQLISSIDKGMDNYLMSDFGFLSLDIFEDDHRMLTSTWAGEVEVWDWEKGNVLFSYESIDYSPIYSRLSHNNRIIGSYGYDGIVRFVDSDTGVELHTIDLNEWLEDLVFSSDDQTAAVSTSNGNIFLISTMTGEILQVFRKEEYAMKDISFSSDNRYLLAAGDRLLLIPLNQEEKERTPLSGEAVLGTVDGRYKAEISSGIISLWNSLNKTNVFNIACSEHETNNIVEIKAIDDLSLLLMSSLSGDLFIRDLGTGKLLYSLKETLFFRYLDNQKNLLVVSGNKWTLWNLESIKIKGTNPKIHEEYTGRLNIDSVEVSNDQKLLITYSGLESLYLWDMESGEKKNLNLPPDVDSIRVDSFVFSVKDKAIYGVESSVLYEWNIKNGNVKVYDVNFFPGDNCIINDEGSRMLSFSGRYFYLLDVSNKVVLQSTRIHENSIISAGFLPMSNRYYTADETILRLWDSVTGEEVFNIPIENDCLNVQYHSDFRQFIASTPEDLFVVYDAESWDFESDDTREDIYFRRKRAKDTGIPEDF